MIEAPAKTLKDIPLYDPGNSQNWDQAFAERPIETILDA
jgi:hypothetical protein